AKVNNEYWILPKTIIIEEIKNQGFEVEILEDIDPKAILGEFAENPVTKEKVPILPAKFVDPEVGTGIVMSVPAHAPYDYIALRDIIQGEHFSEFKDLAEKALKSIKSLFVVPEFDVLPAKTIIEKMNIRSQDEKEKLEKATQEIYSKEFYNGVLKDIYGKFAGKKIYEVKDELAKELCNKKIAIKYYTLPIRFKSRYGGVCIVKIVKDQWFIKYSDPEWKKLAHECVDQMKFIPEDIRKILHHTINWLRDWACTHKKELGTPLPWDPEWTIESLSDSTIYMAFYTIAHIIKQIPPEKIEDDLFDYIFLGIGDEKELTEKYGEVVKKMRREFLYWYPVDLRTSGKDLIQNHLTFYIFHHVAIFPKKLWPRAIAINGWVLRDGKKMSKSLGNIILMLDVAKQSIDAIRFLLAYAGNSGLDDANIEFSRVEEVKRELEEWYRFAIENYNKGTEKETLLDKWFENYIYNILLEVEKEYENMNFKNVLVKGWYELENAYRFYIRFTEPSKNILNKYIEFRTLILYPIAPHIASEILEKIKGRDFAIKPSWPEIKEYDQEIAKIRPFIENLRNDIIRVVELLKRKGKKYNNIKIIIASEKKYEIFDKAKEIVSAYGLKELTKRLIEEFGGDVVKLSQKIFKDPGLLNIYLRREWEMEILENIKPKLEEEFNAKIIIEIEEESKEQKAANALPGKPAIILQ
ncbi:MAG TPA: leucine--tRNA ligase, partial [Candidatus Nanopusillus sp.]|nr:leucine--tRNA ligase [Candidatus Nanopusillus sp.]